MNQGQTDPQVRFLSRGKGYALFLAADEAVLSLSAQHAPQTSSAAVLRMRLLDANPAPRMTGLAELSGKVNYFKGNDPAQWRTNIAAFGQVKCEQVYPGIDLVFYGSSQQELEYDFVVAPGADPNLIRVAYEGADKIETDAEGNLELFAAGERILLHKPRLHQMKAGRLEEIAGAYRVREASTPNGHFEVAFQVAAYDSAQPLVIDPVLTYSTYLGGNGSDVGTGIAVDTNGYAYVVGWTDSPNFPTTNAIDSGLGGAGDRDAFVVKLKPDGSGFVYATYLGGSSGDEGNGIAVDADGNAYIVGDTGYSTDFPTVNAFQSASTGNDAFLAKLSSDGSSLLYSTKLGAAGWQQGRAIAVGTNGNVWITGSTSSTNFPTRNAVQPDFHGGGPNNPYNYKGDVFVARFNTTLSGDASLIYSTFLGGDGEDAPKGIAVDAAGNAY
ncbi:MAG: SBBP repeat-containing protein, partial [Verrucomicrobiota bacterium]